MPAEHLGTELMHDDDDDRNGPRDYAWKEGERESIAAEIRARQDRIERDEMLAWAEQFNEQKRAAERAATEADLKQDWPKREFAMSDSWAAWTRRQIRASEKATTRALTDAIGEVILEQRAIDQKTIAELRAKLDDVTTRLDRLEGIERSSVPNFLRAV
jgi:hypothetical protein